MKGMKPTKNIQRKLDKERKCEWNFKKKRKDEENYKRKKKYEWKLKEWEE